MSMIKGQFVAVLLYWVELFMYINFLFRTLMREWGSTI